MSASEMLALCVSVFATGFVAGVYAAPLLWTLVVRSISRDLARVP